MRERTSENAPNIIYIMLDEVGYYELSCMGHPTLRTPNIDRMAREGMRFTDALAGASVCAPTRCSLLTGKHMGHAAVRGNVGGLPIRADEETLASMLKKVGYATGGFGKWGIGNRGTSGVPEKHGFDIFYGYYNQVHAHSYYPQYLVCNSEEVPLKGNPGDKPEHHYVGETHAQHEIFRESIDFIRENAQRKFFCYLPWTPPHGLWGIPMDDPAWLAFKDKPWRWGHPNPRSLGLKRPTATTFYEKDPVRPDSRSGSSRASRNRVAVSNGGEKRINSRKRGNSSRI